MPTMLQNAVLDRPYRGVALREGLENPMGCGVWGTGEEAGWPAVEQPSREAGRGEAGRTKSDVFGKKASLSVEFAASSELYCTAERAGSSPTERPRISQQGIRTRSGGFPEKAKFRSK
ncbi:hypothetical protein VTN96DRAFT_7309 [Rasamsonia emersonii]